MKNEYIKIFSERIKSLRIKSNFTQKKLSKELEYAQSSIAHWEAGDREPSVDVMLNFAKYFNVSFDYLLGFCDFEEPYNDFKDSSFSERLKDLRLDLGMTQEQLAEKTAISQSSITAWEIGKNSPKITALITLAKFFNVTLEYLMGVAF